METDFLLNFLGFGVQSACDWSDAKMDGGLREGAQGKQGGLTEDNLFLQSVLIDNQAISRDVF